VYSKFGGVAETPRPACDLYERAVSLTAEVKEQLGSLGTYELTVGELYGEHVWWLDGGGDRWALWVSGRHVIKLGAPRGEEIPGDLASDYLDLYPSDLDEHGRADDDAASAGPSGRQRREQAELELPAHLREGAAR
jgi:hypothetical protein